MDAQNILDTEIALVPETMFTWTPASNTSTRRSPESSQKASPSAGSPGAKGQKRGGSIWELKRMPPTEFRMYYNRGDIPATIQHTAFGNKLVWKTAITKLDFHHYLPLFCEGLRETQHPYAFVAEEGAKDMLESGGQLVVPVIPQLILPLKQALDTHDEHIIVKVLRTLQLLVGADPLVGPALVPYFRQLLPVLNQYFTRNVNIGDSIYYGQRRNEDIGELITATLELLEKKGGSDALINIKYMVPCYQSCLQ